MRTIKVQELPQIAGGPIRVKDPNDLVYLAEEGLGFILEFDKPDDAKRPGNTGFRHSLTCIEIVGKDIWFSYVEPLS